MFLILFDCVDSVAFYTKQQTDIFFLNRMKNLTFITIHLYMYCISAFDILLLYVSQQKHSMQSHFVCVCVCMCVLHFHL